MKRSFIRGGGAIGGAIFRIVVESSREGGGGRRSGELLPCRMLPNGARAGIFDGLFAPAVDITELENWLRDMLAPKFVEETGVFDRLGGAPRSVPGRLAGVGLGAVTGFVGIAAFEGVFARGGGADDAAA